MIRKILRLDIASVVMSLVILGIFINASVITERAHNDIVYEVLRVTPFILSPLGVVAATASMILGIGNKGLAITGFVVCGGMTIAYLSVVLSA